MGEHVTELSVQYLLGGLTETKLYLGLNWAWQISKQVKEYFLCNKRIIVKNSNSTVLSEQF
jgi:hypothetical protein